MTLKLERVRKELTQKELQNISGVSIVTIAKIEKGGVDSATIGTLKKLAAALDIPVEELIKES